eukprot:Rmarinus@m.10966
MSYIEPSYFWTGGAAHSLSVCPDGQYCCVAGRDVLRIVSCADDQPLQDSRNLRVGKSNVYSFTDVHWHPNITHKSLLATTATNGMVILWNISKEVPSKPEATFKEHTRTTNCCHWHPSDVNILASGSQDGTIRLWDIRQRGSQKMFRHGGGESIRDIKFSPFYLNYVSAACDNGVIQLWDIRRQDVPERQIHGHSSYVLSVDFHPEDKNRLVTASRDRSIRVWNLINTDAPVHTISSYAAVSRVRWRPFNRDHLASCASQIDHSIHVWDVRRPYIPLVSASQKVQHDVNSDFIFYANSEFRLLSCTKDGYLWRQDIRKGNIPYESVRAVGVTWSPRNKLAVFSESVDRTPLRLSPSLESGTQAPSAENTLPPGIGRSQRRQDGREVQSYLLRVEGSIAELDCEVFAYLARHYQLGGGPVSSVCRHNASIVATAAQTFDITPPTAKALRALYSLWRVIEVLYQEQEPKRMNRPTSFSSDWSESSSFGASALRHPLQIPSSPLSSFMTTASISPGRFVDGLSPMSLVGVGMLSPRESRRRRNSALTEDSGGSNGGDRRGSGSAFEEATIQRMSVRSTLGTSGRSNENKSTCRGVDTLFGRKATENEREGVCSEGVDGSGGGVGPPSEVSPASKASEKHSPMSEPCSKAPGVDNSVDLSDSIAKSQRTGLDSTRPEASALLGSSEENGCLLSGAAVNQDAFKGPRSLFAAPSLDDESDAPSSEFSFDEDDGDEDASTDMDFRVQRACEEEEKVDGGSGGIAPFHVHDSPPLPIDWMVIPAVQEILRGCFECGDVQTCVVIAAAVRCKLQLPEKIAERWFFAYIELLQRFRDWEAVALTLRACWLTKVPAQCQPTPSFLWRCGLCFSSRQSVGLPTSPKADPLKRRSHRMSPRIAAPSAATNDFAVPKASPAENPSLPATSMSIQGDSSHMKLSPAANGPSIANEPDTQMCTPLKRNAATSETCHPEQCRKCSWILSCVICEEPLRGLQVWCKLCGHGGHREHIVDWFRCESECAAGCGCKCMAISAS